MVSKVKFAPPPFCLFMEMTPRCGWRGGNPISKSTRGSPPPNTRRFLLGSCSLRPHVPTNRYLFQVWNFRSQTRDNHLVCPFGLCSAAGPVLGSTSCSREASHASLCTLIISSTMNIRVQEPSSRSSCTLATTCLDQERAEGTTSISSHGFNSLHLRPSRSYHALALQPEECQRQTSRISQMSRS